MPNRPAQYRPHKRKSRRSVAARQWHKLYDQQAWRGKHGASKSFLAANMYCVACEAEGVNRGATVTDHIIPHKGDERLFWDSTNWQPMCGSCHSRKSMREQH